LDAFYRKNYDLVIKLYKNGHNKSYSDLIAGRSFFAKKDFSSALDCFKKALGKTQVLSDFINYLVAKTYESKRDFKSAADYYLKVGKESIYYKKALSTGLKLLFELRNYAYILTLPDKSNYEIILYYKAYASLKLNNKSDFLKYFSRLSKALPGYLYRAYIKLWNEAGSIEINDTVGKALSVACYYKKLYTESLKWSYKIKASGYKELDFRASIYLKLNIPLKASEIYRQISSCENDYTQKAEYMNLICLKYLGKKNEFIKGLIKTANNKSHSYRQEALKRLAFHYAKNNQDYKPLLKELSLSNTDLTDFFLGFTQIIKKENLIPASIILASFSKNNDFKSCIYNFIGERYLLANDKNKYTYYFRLSASLSSNMYATLSYNRLEEKGIDLKSLKKEIQYRLLGQKAKSKKSIIANIDNIKIKAAFTSKVCDAFLEAGDKYHAMLVASRYLSERGEDNLLSVIKYFRSKKALSPASYFTIRLMKYLRNRGFDSIFYKDLAELSFPNTFKKLFLNTNHPCFLRSLAYAESFFDVYAYSKAGAIGLTQKMPSTARSVARDRNLSVYEIFDPALNIKLGNKFISWLLKYFKNKADALGAYNSGPTRFRRYIRKYKSSSLSQAHFINKIPLDETRGYIKNVLFAYMFIKVTGI
jgi:hypothetical protein